MQIQHMLYFLALCEEQNFVRAAMRCGIAQPSMTTAIKRLEQELGGILFLRRPTVKPTPLALALIPHIEQVIANIQCIHQAAARGRGLKSRGRHPRSGAAHGAQVVSKSRSAQR
jgi:LysR family transcriptional regulator, hydrogen peroxide-inducible genes activator